MVTLVTQIEIEDRMGMGAVPQAAPVLKSALTAAHLRVQGDLNVKLDEETTTDVFRLDDSVFYQLLPNKLFRLLLKNMFLKRIDSIKYGATAATITETLTDYTVDLVKGIVYVPQDFDSKFVSVTYTYGFNAQDVKDGLVPAPLREAILSYVPVMIDLNSTTETQRQQGGAVYKAIVAHVGSVLGPFGRSIGFLTRPINP